MDKLHNGWEREVSGIACRHIAQEFLALDVSSVTISEELRVRVEKLFGEERSRLVLRKRTIRRRVVAVLVAAVLAALTACASIPAIREKLYEIMVTCYDKYFSYKSEPVDSATESSEESTVKVAVPVSGFTRRAPSYIPDGYELYLDDSSSNTTRIYYWNPNDCFVICYEQLPIGKLGNHIDCEGVELKQIEINGNSGMVATKSLNNTIEITLFWNDGLYDYYISTTLTFEETMRIAESIC